MTTLGIVFILYAFGFLLTALLMERLYWYRTAGLTRDHAARLRPPSRRRECRRAPSCR